VIFDGIGKSAKLPSRRNQRIRNQVPAAVTLITANCDTTVVAAREESSLLQTRSIRPLRTPAREGKEVEEVEKVEETGEVEDAEPPLDSRTRTGSTSWPDVVEVGRGSAVVEAGGTAVEVAGCGRGMRSNCGMKKKG